MKSVIRYCKFAFFPLLASAILGAIFFDRMGGPLFQIGMGVYMVYLLCLLLYCVFEFFRDRAEEKLKREVARVREAIQKAKSLTLTEAFKTLAEAGILVNGVTQKIVLPKAFWAVDDNKLLASTLVTLVRGHLNLSGRKAGQDVYGWFWDVMVEHGHANPEQSLEVLVYATNLDPTLSLAPSLSSGR